MILVKQLCTCGQEKVYNMICVYIKYKRYDSARYIDVFATSQAV